MKPSPPLMTPEERKRDGRELKRHYHLMRSVLFLLPLTAMICIWCIPDLRTGLFVFGLAFVFFVLLMAWSGMRRPRVPPEARGRTPE